MGRDQKFTNFVDYQNGKIIYRRYAGLYFSLCVDSTDNELVCLEIIHLFVEILDHYFGNVRELDLVYNFHKVFVITDELVLSGELRESSKKVILDRLGILEKMEGWSLAVPPLEESERGVAEGFHGGPRGSL